ncbi:MAG: hypothetical protein AAF665_11235 [Pseudomonadota bacterium]
MRKAIQTILLGASLAIACATLASADGPTRHHQHQTGAKHVAFANAAEATCPRERLTIYRGNLYCRTPLYAVHAPRHPHCPPNVWGLYAGNMHCFGRR